MTGTIYESPDGPLKNEYYGNAARFIVDSPYLKANPEKPLFIDALTGESLKAREFVQLLQQIHTALRNEGIGEHDVVIIYAVNTIYTVPIQHGILAAGAIVSPANAAYLPEELAYQIKATNAKLAITIPAMKPTVEKACALAEKNPAILTIEELVARARKCAPTPPVEFADPRDSVSRDAYYCFSSGTSGLPKGVMSTHRNMISNCQQQVQSGWRIYNTDHIYMGILPLSHIYGLCKFGFTTPYIASTLIVHPKFELVPVLDSIVKYKVTHMHVVPPVVVLLAKSPVIEQYKDELKKTLRKIYSGAAPLSKSLIRATEKRIGVPVLQMYGLTETSPVTHLPADEDSCDPAAVGWLVAGLEARIVGADGVDVPPGEPGELWLRGPNIMKGYLDNAEATAAAFGDGRWFKTGDVAIYNKSSQQYYIVDRVKELIKSKGHQVAPAEVEALLLKHPNVRDAAVVGVYSEEEATEYPRAFVVLDEGISPIDVKNWFDKSVARHKRLWGGLVVLEAIPKSPSGKILRRTLRDGKGFKVHGDKPAAKL
ncbi:hypothetical protein TRVA0_004S02894 [Trichomonascus vanleenenianus]|uniref:uncharacterized protein n=1 Tax=Trichomonascus vanleenenianus TaxID=2268995 RepID=UPI003ECAE04C